MQQAARDGSTTPWPTGAPTTPATSVPPDRPGRSPWRRRLAALLTTAVGLVATWSALTALVPPLAAATEDVNATLEDYYLAMSPNLAWATVLFLVSAALAARKRAGWLAVLITHLLMLVGDLSVPLAGDSEFVIEATDPHPVLGTVFHLVVVVVLVVVYREFPARVRPRSWLRALLTLVIGLALATLLGWMLVARTPSSLTPQEHLEYAFVTVIGGLPDDAPFGRPPVAGWVTWLLGLLGSLALIVAVVVLFRSRRAANALRPIDETAVRGLLARFGTGDSLGYFATRRDKSVVFAPDGLAAVGYRVDLGVCLASGDPIGSPDSWDGAIRQWLAVSAAFGWAPGVIGASQAGAAAYHRHGLSALGLGDEAVLETDRFSLRGAAQAGLRQAVTRAARDGVSVRLRRHAQVPAEELARAQALADAWRGEEPERGFSMALGRLGDPSDGDCLLVEAVQESEAGAEAKLVGLLTFVPWGGAGASLDLMRRAPDAPNGTTELMVAEVCRRGSEVGIRRISLNFAVFREVFEEGGRLGAGPVLRLWRMVLVFLSRWWQLESLYKSNARYRPTWVSRYLCFSDVRVLPRIGVAVGVAEGFLRIPRLRRTPRVDAHIGSTAPDVSRLLPATSPAPKRPQQVQVRLDKVTRLRLAGVDPWPVAVPPSHHIRQAREQPEGTVVGVAGRVLALRDLGGVVFVALRDWSGDVQLLLDAARLGRPQLAAFTRDVDLGDLVAVRGPLGRSRRGELSVLAEQWHLDAKCLHPLPDKWHGLSDPEARVRQRHLDLAVNPATRARTTARAAVIRALRDTLHEHGFLEVETPVLQQTHGGANARPFRTHINAYDLDLYLRIAPELYLKRLCVGGLDRVFELGRVFRNEGVDFSHNPEFTILEAYQAHADYRVMMDLCRHMIQAATRAANGSCKVPTPDGGEVDISGDWPVVTLFEAVSRQLEQRGGQAVDQHSSLEQLRAQADLAGIAWLPGWDAGQVALELYERLVEEHTTVPTFYTDFPVSVSPLTRSHRSEAGLTERWDLVAWGVELGTAYSELTDPLEQRRRLTEQSIQAAAGDPEAMELDEDFLTTLEYGMPPTGGLGLGVDRIVMLVTGASIRETLAFPMSRPAVSDPR